MEIQKTLNSQSNLEKEEWNWRNQPAWLQTILQSYNHQDSMVLAQRQKYRSMEQNRKPRNESMHLWTPYLWQRRQEYTMEKRQSLLQVVLGKLVNHLWKNELEIELPYDPAIPLLGIHTEETRRERDTCTMWNTQLLGQEREKPDSHGVFFFFFFWCLILFYF